MDMIKDSNFLRSPLARHVYYFFGYQLMTVLAHLIILSVVIFFHFLLDHRLADIQDWIFFHGWEILILGKLISLGVMSRFMGILSSERSPLIHILSESRGVLRSELFIAIVIMIIGLLIVGRPFLQDSYKWSLYPLFISYVGAVTLLGGDALILIILNKSIPLSRKSWSIEVALFSVISFLVYKLIFLYGTHWNLHIVFSFILTYYCLRLRGEFVWLHALILIVAFLAPFFSLFGLDPLWGSRFSPFTLSESVTGIAFSVLSLVVIVYLRAKKLNLIPT